MQRSLYTHTYLEIYQQSKTYQPFEYLLYKIAVHAAPTLTGEKPASLINFKGHYHNQSMVSLWDAHKEGIQAHYHLRYQEVRRSDGHVVVIFYNPDMVESILKNHEAFLKHLGYHANDNLQQALNCLTCRFEGECPHEVGLFLGYPIDDVLAYIKQPESKALTVGYWKAYSKKEEAEATFMRYDAAKLKFMTLVQQGLYPSIAIKRLLTQTA